MHYFHQHKSDLNSRQLRDMSDRFEALRNIDGLCKLLGITESTLLRQITKPEYFSFHIPKPGGQKRLIQHPGPALKGTQTILNRYLQAVYYNVKPTGSHGFILNPADELQPRNIYTNALAHNKSDWFLNIDFKDFFHTVTLTHLRDLFRQTFSFSPELTSVLTGICAWQGRLPMGAPTSPVLSNLVCLYLDYKMEHLAESYHAIYTRYADDLTFSFRDMPPPNLSQQIRKVVLSHSFTINEQKIRLQSRMDQPEITGLVIGKGQLPTISPAWMKRLKEEIKILRWFMSEAVRERGMFNAYVFDKFRQSVQGQVAFVGFILGKDDRTYRKLVSKMG